jgi:hypothetical protein
VSGWARSSDESDVRGVSAILLGMIPAGRKLERKWIPFGPAIEGEKDTPWGDGMEDLQRVSEFC